MAIGHLREALAGELDVEQRFRATMLLAGLLGQTGRVADAVDVLEEQIEAFADRPDLRATAEAALVNVTRIDPATRPRAARVIERLRRRVDAGEERDPAVLGTIAAEMGMAGEPAGPMAEIAERALDGLRPRPIGTAAGLVGLQRGALARRGRALRRGAAASSIARWRWPASAARCSTSAPSLTFRAELYLQTGDLAARRGRRAQPARDRGRATGGRWAQGFAAAWLGEVLIERGELDEAAEVLAGGPRERAAAPSIR